MKSISWKIIVAIVLGSLVGIWLHPAIIIFLLILPAFTPEAYDKHYFVFWVSLFFVSIICFLISLPWPDFSAITWEELRGAIFR